MICVTRLPDWRSRLQAFIIDINGKPFQYGALDCAIFSASAVEVMTGTDLVEKWRGKYKTLAKGMRIAKKMGFDNHVEVLASLLPEIAPSFAQVGDVGVVEDVDGSLGIGIVQGEYVYVMTPEGIGVTSRMNMVRAFKV